MNIDLRLGDCLDIMPNIDDKSVDLIICDLPYGTTACKWDIIIPFASLWYQYKRIIKDKGVIVLFGSEPFSSMLRLSNIEWYKYDWVWEKNNAGNFQLVNYQPLKIHENIIVFYNESPIMDFANIMVEYMNRLNLKISDISKLLLSRNGKMTGWVSNKLNGSQLPSIEQWEKICDLFKIENKYYEIMSNIKKVTYNTILQDVDVLCSNKGKSGRLGHISSLNKRETYRQTKTGYPKSILRYDREVGLHPTQKPVKLLEFLIKTFSNENEVVLDNCAGSFSSAIACINTNRQGIFIEKDKYYFDIGRERVKNHLKSTIHKNFELCG